MNPQAKAACQWVVPAPPRNVIRTGGSFDRHVGHHFLAMSSGNLADFAATNSIVSGALVSITYSGISLKAGELAGTERFDGILQLCDLHGIDLFMDCGAFSLVMAYVKAHGGNPQHVFVSDEVTHSAEYRGLDTLWRRFLHRYQERLWGFVELDIGTMERRREIRQSYHAEGLFPIPVFRLGFDPWEYFDELMETHDRVCFAGAVKLSRSHRTMLMYEAARRMRQYPHCAVHVLGSKPTRELTSLGFHTCDSTTYLNLPRFGLIQKINLSGTCAYRERMLLRDIAAADLPMSSSKTAQTLGMYQYSGFTRSRNLAVASMKSSVQPQRRTRNRR